ncbi:DUF4190 domain-containing protein [Streptomyces macrosporus]|uniref:DUF4190 domain-containing protein n=1 Tax=Streptomyces macrosporus TaxID=44032 RepID=A0ABN3KG24_9ACTN
MPSHSYPPPQDWDPYARGGGYQEPEPPPPPAPAERPRDGMGVAAFVLGLIALVMFWTVLLGVVPGVLALVFGVVGHRRAKRGEATNGWMALTGAITGFIGLVLSAALISAALAFLGSDAVDDLRNCLRDADTPVEQEQCVRDFRDRYW